MGAFERAAFWTREMFNDYLSYRARREGFSYERPEHLYPVEDDWSLKKFVGAFTVIVICIAAIAIISN